MMPKWQVKNVKNNSQSATKKVVISAQMRVVFGSTRIRSRGKSVAWLTGPGS